mgnify:CR=1 FL=1
MSNARIILYAQSDFENKLYGAPQMSSIKAVYRKHTYFSMEHIIEVDDHNYI